MSAVTEINPPHPEVILGRVADVSGYPEVLPQNPGSRASTDYVLRTETADMLHVKVKHSRFEAYIPIGYFDSVSEDWRFPPELIEPGERQAMAKVGQYLYGAARPYVESELMLDAQHPVTVQAHQKVAAVLAPFKPLDWLKRDGVTEQLVSSTHQTHRVLGADEYTTTAATVDSLTYDPFSLGQVSPRQTRQVVVENGLLKLNYIGLQVESGRPGGKARSTRNVTLAVRSPGQQNIWFPNKNILTQKEWEALHVIPEMLGSLAMANPQFSPAHCAIMYNQPSRGMKQ